jgi:hypothetical protein
VQRKSELYREHIRRKREKWASIKRCTLISLKAARPATLKRFYYQHNVRSTQLVQERLQFIHKAVALTTEEARVSVAVLQLRHLVEQLRALLLLEVGSISFADNAKPERVHTSEEYPWEAVFSAPN